MRKKETYMYKIWDETKVIPFFGSERDLQRLTELVENYRIVIKGASSVRQIILETWLTVDYAIRQLLLTGFDLSRFCSDDFDLQYRLLPWKFSDLLDLLKYTVDFNVKHPSEQEPEKHDRVGGFRSSFEFLQFVKDSYPDIFKQIKDIEQQYIIKQNPELDADREDRKLGAFDTQIFPRDEEKPTRMKPEWLDVARKLDANWFKQAHQLNKARNKAAHSVHEDEIAKCFGLCGPNLRDLVRGKCSLILNILMGLKE